MRLLNITSEAYNNSSEIVDVTLHKACLIFNYIVKTKLTKFVISRN